MAVFLWRPCRGAKPLEQDREVLSDDGANQNDVDVEKATASAATGGRETFGGDGMGREQVRVE